METIETVTIKGPDGKPLRINATDFKVGEHELYDDKSDGEPAPVKSEASSGGDTGATGSNGGNTAPAPGAAPPAGAPAPKAK